MDRYTHIAHDFLQLEENIQVGFQAQVYAGRKGEAAVATRWRFRGWGRLGRDVGRDTCTGTAIYVSLGYCGVCG